MKKKQNLMIAAAVLVILAVVLGLVYWKLAPRGQEGAKTVTVEIVHGDQSTRTVVMHTDAAYLGDALDEQEGLVAGDEGAYGLFIKTVDGETATDADRTWWCITKDGAELSTGADQTPIEDGEHYELTLKTY